jgi:aquaporin Z
VDRLSRAWVAEFVATFTLIFIGAGAVSMNQDPNGPGLVGIALAHGLALAILVSVLGHISGAHVNPAVTIGLWVTGRVDPKRAAVYIGSQLAGAVAGALVLRALMPRAFWEPAALGTPQVNHAVGVGVGQGVLIEAVLTFFLMLAIFGTAVDPRGAFSKVAGFSIGLVLTFDILMGGPLTGAAMNPARWFGPALVSGTWSDGFVYIIGPVAGAVAASLVYWGAFLRGHDDLLPAADG